MKTVLLMMFLALSSASHAQEGKTYWMEINGELELGSIVRGPNNEDHFMTCPGGQLVVLDFYTLRESDSSCNRDNCGAFPCTYAAKITELNRLTGQYTVTAPDGSEQNWKVPNLSDLRDFSEGDLVLVKIENSEREIGSLFAVAPKPQ
jgi:hypothetical protein